MSGEADPENRTGGRAMTVVAAGAGNNPNNAERTAITINGQTNSTMQTSRSVLKHPALNLPESPANAMSRMKQTPASGHHP